MFKHDQPSWMTPLVTFGATAIACGLMLANTACSGCNSDTPKPKIDQVAPGGNKDVGNPPTKGPAAGGQIPPDVRNKIPSLKGK